MELQFLIEAAEMIRGRTSKHRTMGNNLEKETESLIR